MVDSIVRSLSQLPDIPHVVTIGSFDGVHRGHQHLIERVTAHAKRLGVPCCAVTFDPLPAEVLRPEKAPPRLCTTSERSAQMISHGLDRVVILPFDEEMANQSALEFLQELAHSARPEMIVVGEDFAFGHKRHGTPQMLAEHADAFGYECEIVERVNPESRIEWSSSFIRRAIAGHGAVDTAAIALGRPFRLSGVVQSGDHRGRDLGYPTANLRLPDGLVVPSDGIYAAFVSINSEQESGSLPSLVYVGSRPTFGWSSRVIEVFLLDFQADLYGREITVDFIDRIRGDRAFDSAEALVEQMRLDEAKGRRIFARYGDSTATATGE